MVAESLFLSYICTIQHIVQPYSITLKTENTMLAAMLPLGVIGPWQIVVIVLLVVLLFGGRKIPELMRGMGRGMKEFKDALNKDYTAEDENQKKTTSDKDGAAQ